MFYKFNSKSASKGPVFGSKLAHQYFFPILSTEVIILDHMKEKWAKIWVKMFEN